MELRRPYNNRTAVVGADAVRIDTSLSNQPPMKKAFECFKYWLAHDDKVLSRRSKPYCLFLIVLLIFALHITPLIKHRAEADGRNQREIALRRMGGSIIWIDDFYTTTLEETKESITAVTTWREWWSWRFKRTYIYTKEKWDLL